MTKYDPHKWRWDRFYNEQCDLWYKNNENILSIIFDRSCITKPGEKPFLNLDGYGALIKSIELNTSIDENL